MTGQPSTRVIHDPAAQHFYADVAGGRAVAAYRREGDRIILTHTSVPDEAEGQGVGSALAHEAFGYARAHGLKVTPQCPFMAAFEARHAEYEDLR